MVALRCVRPDGAALPAVALRGSGSGLPAEESPQEEPHRVMRGATGAVQPRVGLPGPSSASTAGWTESRRTHGFLPEQQGKSGSACHVAGKWARSVSLNWNHASRKERPDPNHKDCMMMGIKN